MHALRKRGVVMGFEAQAKRHLANLASGFPWFVHVIGEDALIRADAEGSHAVRMNHVHAAETDLTRNRFAQQFADAYQMAVRDSAKREIVLRMAAKWPGRDIPTGEIYRLVREPPLGVRSPSNYKGHLCSEHYGPVFLTPAYQKQGLVRFANEMFKVYIRVRGSLYEDVDANVNRVWQQAGEG